MSQETQTNSRKTFVSIGIIAWNEEKAIVTTLESLFEQTIFAEIVARGLKCEIICLANGCTDNTVHIARKFFLEKERQHPFRGAISGEVRELEKRGKANAWNKFVHEVSAKESKFLILMDADLVFLDKNSLRSMVETLEKYPEAAISVDRPCKDISLRKKKTLTGIFSLAATKMTQVGAAQLTGQLYCIRAETARKIFLAADLGSCEDGFIKQLVCTDFLTHAVKAERIVVAPEASHVFEAYTSPLAILKNQKRQIMGQTRIHILIDWHLPKLPAEERMDIRKYFEKKENTDPLWMKKLIASHLLRVKFFWRLYPDLLTLRFRRLARLSDKEKLRCLPVAIAGWFIALVASFMAWRAMKAGSTDYWPHARSVNATQVKLDSVETVSTP